MSDIRPTNTVAAADSAETAFLMDCARRRHAEGDANGAAVFAAEALRHDDGHVGALTLLARTMLGVNPAGAAEMARRARARVPDDIDSLMLLGQALSAIGDLAGAVEAFHQVVEVAPDNPAARVNYGLALLRAGQNEAALAACEAALRVASTMPEAHANHGHALKALGRFDAAMSAYQEALRLRPEHVDALCGIGALLHGEGRSHEAIAAYRRATGIAPDWAAAWADLGLALLSIGDFRAAGEAQRHAIALAPTVASYADNLLMSLQYDPDTDEEAARDEAVALGTRQCAGLPAALDVGHIDRNPDKRLRIGYVSADFCEHPVGWLGSAVFAAHDQAAVETIGYAALSQRDGLTERIGRSFSGWRDVSGQADDTVAAQIAADGIDILVDLSGRTAGNRLGVFARRAAPVQVSWLGYFATTGLPTMDYALLDDAHLVDGGEAFFSERVLRLAGGRWSYAPPDDAPAVSPPPALQSHSITFGCFNNAAKLNDAVIALWARILDAVPTSRLCLKWHSFADPMQVARVRDQFARHGIDGGRIVTAGASPHRAMLAEYAGIDIALDPFPFSGALTSCEALWMGVPVVTLPGRRPVSRQTHAILAATGLSEWSATSTDDYVAIARRLASDIDALARMRALQRNRLRGSALMDAPSVARGLEAAYRTMWRSWVSGA